MRSLQTQLDTHTLREAEITNPRLRRCFLYHTIIHQPLMHNGSLYVCVCTIEGTRTNRETLFIILYEMC